MSLHRQACPYVSREVDVDPCADGCQYVQELAHRSNVRLVATLVLLNGAPGSGKSTLARRFAQEHPLTLALDIDVVRGMLGGSVEQSAQSGTLARALAVTMARSHLSGGFNVIVPQFLGRLEFVLTLQQMCKEVGARFTEVALVSTVTDVVERFERRSLESTEAQHLAAAEWQRRSGGREELIAMYHRLLLVIENRPQTHRITSVQGDIASAYAQLCSVVEGEIDGTS